MRVTVRVPATSANLGPGFDAFGLALDLCNEIVVDTDGPPGVRWEGEGEAELPADGRDLVSRTIVAIAARMGLEPPPFSLRGRNLIPLERGLGSSSSATVGGVVLASVVLGLGWEHDPATVFAAAAEIEGHPDNAAPAAFGGFTVALPGGTVHRFEPHPGLRPVAIVPDVRLSTADARTALAPEVPRADAVFNAAHAALVLEALVRDPALLTVALRDRLHEDVRLALVPEVADAMEELRRARVPACVSGAGPTLLAFELEGGPTVPETIALDHPSWRLLRPGVRSRGFDVDRA
jgi:homoserine kinase